MTSFQLKQCQNRGCLHNQVEQHVPRKREVLGLLGTKFVGPDGLVIAKQFSSVSKRFLAYLLVDQFHYHYNKVLGLAFKNIF